MATTRTSPELAELLADLPSGLVFQPNLVANDWREVADELTEAFRLTKAAFQRGEDVVYVVDHDDLLGRRGSGSAMVAAGLLSGARTAALEGSRSGLTVNVIAAGSGAEPEVVARWVRLLLQPGGPTGELIRLGADHLGRALP
ncbi:MAG: hypothetical protein KatS3mg011_0333 [Acidimicrobiia bacterium]|nr:MAG: hypothetical protein KatS3mg011_0333 [Acidimicrobiia bacterium]